VIIVFLPRGLIIGDAVITARPLDFLYEYDPPIFPTGQLESRCGARKFVTALQRKLPT
jgi:hypothetical protein